MTGSGKPPKGKSPNMKCLLAKVLTEPKPQLPPEIQKLLPSEIVWLINTYVPPYEKTPPPSPGLQEQLKKIQNMHIKGLDSNYMYDLEDFLLDDIRPPTKQNKRSNEIRCY